MAKMYEMKAPRAKKDGGTYWHRVGTAWEGDKGIQLVFDSLPLPDAEGRCAVNLFEPRDRDQSHRDGFNRGGQSGSSQLEEDSIPF